MTKRNKQLSSTLTLATVAIVGVLLWQESPRSLSLMWDYEKPLPDANVEFVVEVSTDLRQWTPVAVVDAPPYQFVANQPQEFFRVASRWKAITITP